MLHAEYLGYEAIINGSPPIFQPLIQIGIVDIKYQQYGTRCERHALLVWVSLTMAWLS